MLNISLRDIINNYDNIDALMKADFIAIWDIFEDLYYIYKDGFEIYENGSLPLNKGEYIQRKNKAKYDILFRSDFIGESLKNKIKTLQTTLQAVMHSVDKWFDEVDENKDEVNRAAEAREIALKAIESRDELISEMMKSIKSLQQYQMIMMEGKPYPLQKSIEICNKILDDIQKFYK
jgi:gas vesicle protein